MPAPLTLVIPTLNAAAALPDTAAALMPGLTRGAVAGLVVSDGGSADDTCAIARDLGATLVTGPPGRGGQIGRGVAAARTEWVLILHADTHLGPRWPDAVLDHIAAHPGQAAYFRLRFRAEGLAPRLVEAGANWRSSSFDLPYGDQGLLISKTLLAQIGGVPDIPLMEDVALARLLKGRLRRLDAIAETSATRYQNRGWIRQSGANLWTLLRYKFGASPYRLARKY